MLAVTEPLSTAMTMKNYREEFPLAYCAARFLRQWEKHEASLYRGISSAPDDATVSKALAYFQVSRNFADLKKKPENLGKIRSALVLVRQDETLASETAKVTALAKALEREFNKFNLSAATKLLWLSYRAPYIVHDKRAVTALSRRFKHKFDSRQYAEYAGAWRAEFDKIASDIEPAIASLSKGRDFMPRTSLTEMDLVDLAKQQWFKERVFDIFLWEVGGEG